MLPRAASRARLRAAPCPLLHRTLRKGKPVVGGAVVNDDRLEIAESLALERVEAFGDVVLTVVECNDHGEVGLLHFLNVLAVCYGGPEVLLLGRSCSAHHYTIGKGGKGDMLIAWQLRGVRSYLDAGTPLTDRLTIEVLCRAALCRCR